MSTNGNAKSIHFDFQKLSLLKRQYEEAKAIGVESFIFEEQEILVSYAKYLIEFLEGQLK